MDRLLDAALKNKAQLNWVPEKVQRIASHCNDRKVAAKMASEKSDEIFLALFVKESGPLVVQAAVASVMDCSADCILLDMAVVRRVYLDDLDGLENYVYVKSDGKRSLVLKWKDLKDVQVLTLFTQVTLSLEPCSDKLDFKVKLIKPETENEK